MKVIEELSLEEKKRTLLEFWEKLSIITTLTFSANSKAHSGWMGKGKGEVTVKKQSPEILLFEEKGFWKGEKGLEMAFFNVFRWVLNPRGVFLEHLRLGEDHPVFLFSLSPEKKGSLFPVEPHFCGHDSYTARIDFSLSHLHCQWQVKGPKKDEIIDYFYR